MTVQSLIERALRKISAIDEGESATAAELADGIEVLNDVLLRFSTERWGIHKTSLINHTLTAGQSSYTIGATGDIAETRPIKILDAFLRRDGYDYPLRIQANPYMDDVYDKTTRSQTWNIQYEPTYPDGTLRLDPTPPNSTDILFLRVWQPLATYSAGSETIDLPPEYTNALMWTVAQDYASEFEIRIPDNVALRADESLKILKRLHASPVPQQNTNPMGVGRSSYDINSDRYRSRR